MRYDSETEIAKDALEIWSGACNPRGIARGITEMIDWYVENRGGSDGVRDKAPLAVALAQLLYLLHMGLGDTPHTGAGFDADLAETQRLARNDGAIS